MRISDWSSDVCSSDLAAGGLAALEFLAVPRRATALLEAVRIVEHVVDDAKGFVLIGVSGFAARLCLGYGVRRIGDVGRNVVGVRRAVSDARRIEFHARSRATERKSTRLNSSHSCASRMQSSA